MGERHEGFFADNRSAEGKSLPGGAWTTEVSLPKSADRYPLVPTKLLAPRLHDRVVERGELVERLREGRSSALTLVCAPAGYGKTTLLTQWVTADRDRTSFAWVSLDGADSDPVRLWSHVIAALWKSHGTVGERSLPALAAGPQSIEEWVLPLLIDELSDCPPVVLVLDDWHVVRSKACDRTIEFFIARAPSHVQLVVSSRSDPGFSVARLRAHGDLTEIRTADLRISPGDVVALSTHANLRLSALDARRLTERTEGWAAGIALALIALTEQEDPRRFLREFSGDSHYVFDYLAHDVLASVEPRIRDFMTRSSILERLSGPLCDAVLETSGSAGALAEIARSNLFLVALDETGTEYRYHNLFAAMLSRELTAGAPDSISELHARASVWLEEHSHSEDAIEHAIASRDTTRASELVMRAAPACMSGGRFVTIGRWLEALSWPEALQDRQLAIVRAWDAGLAGRGRTEVERWLTVAETGPDWGPLSSGVSSLRAAVAMLRSALLTRGVEVAEREARLGLELEPAESIWRFTLLVPLGQAMYLTGRREKARATLVEAVSHPLAIEIDASGEALALSYLSMIAAEDSDLPGAESLARKALSIARERHLSPLAKGNPTLALGVALMHGTDLHEAIDHLERAVDLLDAAGPTYWRAHASLRLAEARHVVGDDSGASAALVAARADLDELPDLGILGDLYRATDDKLHQRVRREGFLGDALSQAEVRILHGLVNGDSLGDIARELWLSPNTVKTHRRSIYRKLGVNSRDELAAHVASADGLRELLQPRPVAP